MNFVSMGPLLHFFDCKVSSLGKCSALRHNKVVDEAFCKSINNSFGKIFACRESKSMHSKCLSSKDKSLPLPLWKLSSIINPAPTSWLIILWNGTILGVSVGICCWHIGHSVEAIARSALVNESPHY